MIISRYLTKEVLNTLLAVTFVLLLIFLSQQLVRYLSYAAAGKLASNILFQLMGLEIPYLLALLLPMGLYLGIVLAYGRLYADSEMSVLHACGMSVGRLVSITSILALIITGIVFILTLWVNPWIASQKEKLIAHSVTTDNLLDLLMPGRFKVSNDGKRVLYVESIARNRKQASNLFIADQGANMTEDNNTTTWTVISAGRGSQMRDPVTHDRFLIASDGYRYDGMPGQNDFKIIQFKKYAARMPQTVTTSKRQEQESISTANLWKNYHDPDSAAEFQWRFSVPISALLLGLLAIPLSRIKPRRGPYSQVILAVLIYIIYVNTLFITRAWVEQKILPISIGMWWVHLIVLFMVMTFVMVETGWNIKRSIGRAS